MMAWETLQIVTSETQRHRHSTEARCRHSMVQQWRLRLPHGQQCKCAQQRNAMQPRKPWTSQPCGHAGHCEHARRVVGVARSLKRLVNRVHVCCPHRLKKGRSRTTWHPTNPRCAGPLCLSAVVKGVCKCLSELRQTRQGCRAADRQGARDTSLVADLAGDDLGLTTCLLGNGAGSLQHNHPQSSTSPTKLQSVEPG
jgi:hypothetical protein